jgi:hypothetical protein
VVQSPLVQRREGDPAKRIDVSRRLKDKLEELFVELVPRNAGPRIAPYIGGKQGS